MNMYETPEPSFKEMIVPCDCSDTHYLIIRWDDDSWKDKDEEWHMYPSFYILDEYRSPKGIWERVQAAVGMLTGKSFCGGEVSVRLSDLQRILDWTEDRIEFFTRVELDNQDDREEK